MTSMHWRCPTARCWWYSADEVVPAADVVRWVERLGPAAQLVYLEGVSHFFHQRLNDLRAVVTDSLGTVVPPAQ